MSEILGSPDDLKFCSSMTLFGAVSADPEFTTALAEFYGGRSDQKPLGLLARQPGPRPGVAPQQAIFALSRGCYRNFRVTRFGFDVLPYFCATSSALKADAGAARHSEQREGWLEVELDLDPVRLV